MSAETHPSLTGVVRGPQEPLWRLVARRGIFGLCLGLLVALVFVVLDHRKANSVSQVGMHARVLLLQYRVEKDAWPADCDLAAPGAQFGGFALEPLATAVAKCQVPGRWAFAARSPTGGPAVVFTPAEPGRSYERAFGVADGWLDDGDPEKGDFLVRPDVALLRLSVE